LKKLFIVSTALVFLDQILKVWVKTNLLINESFKVFNQDWFVIKFLENNGAAFGFLGESGVTTKIGLTLFRILVVIAGIYYIKKIIKQLSTGAIIALGLIIGGAVGNIVDSTFYGVVFNESEVHNPWVINQEEPAKFLSDQGGYSSVFQGKVVDMFSFNIFQIDLPQWMAVPIPFSDKTILSFLEGHDNVFTFFAPVFNLADAGISIGMFMLILFYRKEF
jgi:signal peptidase II|tara:strand:- start:2204 stop:2863 length:660 start_codon:yes stop_codon:yes gene_type:complete